MNFEVLQLATVLLLLGTAIVMFILNKPRMDAVGLIMICLLPLTGILTVEETLSGFASPAVILVALLFVVGECLTRTGIVQYIGDFIVQKAGSSENKLIIFLMTAVSGIGAFMSSTGVVAIFIPVALRISKQTGINAGRLMMPIAYAALLSGMLTLVATPPNLIVHAQLRSHNYPGFEFFSFLPLGLPLIILAILYMLLIKRFLSRGEKDGNTKRRRPHMREWIDEFQLTKRNMRIKILKGSSLINKTLAELDMRQSKGVNILAIERTHRLTTRLITPRPDTVLKRDDVLLLDVINLATDESIASLCRRYKLHRMKLSGQYFADSSQQLGMAQALIPPSSHLIGRTPAEIDFRKRFDMSIVGLKRGTEPLTVNLADEPFQSGDILLLSGPWRAIRRRTSDMRDMIILDLPEEIEDAAPAPHSAPFALIGIMLMVVLMMSDIIPNVLSALIVCLFLGATRCITLDTAYRCIHWPSIILIVGMLPFSIALEKTGGIRLASNALLNIAGGADPHILLGAVFLLTAILGLFISNTATAVLMAPVAIGIAHQLHLSPTPFAMSVALAASAAFMTPVSSPVNTLIMTPGNYKFFDFVKFGVPFTLASMFLMIFLIPAFFPF